MQSSGSVRETVTYFDWSGIDVSLRRFGRLFRPAISVNTAPFKSSPSGKWKPQIVMCVNWGDLILVLYSKRCLIQFCGEAVFKHVLLLSSIVSIDNF